MGHFVKLFAGLPSALAPFRALHPDARLYMLTRDAGFAVLPFDEAVQDALHRRYGTGDWPECQRIALSTADQSFAAECSQHAPLAYLETEYHGGTGGQSAVFWQAGRLAIGPASIDSNGPSAQRAPTLWPINTVLRALGVRAHRDLDEFSSFGLDLYRSNEQIHAEAWPLPV